MGVTLSRCLIQLLTGRRGRHSHATAVHLDRACLHSGGTCCSPRRYLPVDQVGAAGHTDGSMTPPSELGELVAAGIEEIDEVTGQGGRVAEEGGIGVLVADTRQSR